MSKVVRQQAMLEVGAFISVSEGILTNSFQLHNNLRYVYVLYPKISYTQK